jgi:hypothetical protein
VSRLGRELDDHTVVAHIHDFSAKLACKHGYRVEVLVPVSEGLRGCEGGRSSAVVVAVII